MNVVTGAGALLTVSGKDAYGNDVGGLTYAWSTTIGTVQPSPDGQTAAFFADDSGGSGTITVSAGDKSATISVSITESALPVGRQFTQSTSVLFLVIAILAIGALVFVIMRYRAVARELAELRKGGGEEGGRKG